MEQYGSIGKILVAETRHCACPAKPRRCLDCQTSRAFSVLLARDSESSSGGLEPLFHAGPIDSNSVVACNSSSIPALDFSSWKEAI
uniref:(California timema) hypothetical protein n=1 Tax=Timema californicum TaxID=61474 RepID=A0A7R9J7D4_TIMCA|nr:unnamed protein product [Timema californicum]